MTVEKTFMVHIPFCPENLTADEIEVLIYDELAVKPYITEMK